MSGPFHTLCGRNIQVNLKKDFCECEWTTVLPLLESVVSNMNIVVDGSVVPTTEQSQNINCDCAVVGGGAGSDSRSALSSVFACSACVSVAPLQVLQLSTHSPKTFSPGPACNLKWSVTANGSLSLCDAPR